MTGIFGVISDSNCISTLYYGTDYHSHLGTEYGGIAFIDDRGVPIKKIHDIRNSQFKTRFYEGADMIDARMAIGVISDKEPQPLIFHSKFGTFSLCVSGLITNVKELSEEMMSEGITFSELNDGEINSTELVANLINKGDDILSGIARMQEKIEGSATILLMTGDGIYAARDRMGVLPLAIGKKDGEMAVASESCSFPNLGFDLEKYLGPGEVVFLGKEGMRVLKEPGPEMKTCAFLWIYTGFPASTYEDINVERVRENCGGFLALRDHVKPDLAAGVPDSGTSHAIGYSLKSGVPFRRVLFKYTPGYGRSYLPLDQKHRDRIALMKLIPNRATIEGNSVVLCEDSIVRGTQLKNFTINKLKDSGVREVHVRVACPPLMYPCIYNLSTRSLSELAARRAIRAIEGNDLDDVSEYLDPDSDKFSNMVRWIADDLDIDTLHYLRIDDMVNAIGLPREKLCLHCWTGEGSG
ncbi:MAG: amidophosphoribosyltransferase [Thermoplasmatota archaeon]